MKVTKNYSIRNMSRRLRSVRSEFGNTYSLIIAGKEVFATKSIAHRSPVDRRTILGYVQMATPLQLNQAIEAAAHAFKTWGTTDYKYRYTNL